MKSKENNASLEPTLADARARVDKIASDRAQLVTRQNNLSGRLETTKRDIGRKYLEGDRAALRESAEINAEIDAIDSALSVLSEHEVEAKVYLERATAHNLRVQASDKKTQLEELNAKTAKVLAQLSDLENVTFTRSILSSEPVKGAWLQPGTLEPPLPHQGIQELGLNVPIADQKIAVPLSRRLMMQIEELELQAEIIEQRLSMHTPASA